MFVQVNPSGGWKQYWTQLVVSCPPAT